MWKSRRGDDAASARGVKLRSCPASPPPPSPAYFLSLPPSSSPPLPPLSSPPSIPSSFSYLYPLFLPLLLFPLPSPPSIPSSFSSLYPLYPWPLLSPSLRSHHFLYRQRCWCLNILCWFIFFFLFSFFSFSSSASASYSFSYSSSSYSPSSSYSYYYSHSHSPSPPSSYLPPDRRLRTPFCCRVFLPVFECGCAVCVRSFKRMFLFFCVNVNARTYSHMKTRTHTRVYTHIAAHMHVNV